MKINNIFLVNVIIITGREDKRIRYIRTQRYVYITKCGRVVDLFNGECYRPYSKAKFKVLGRTLLDDYFPDYIDKKIVFEAEYDGLSVEEVRDVIKKKRLEKNK